jgi:hypothetical protein
MDDLVIFFWVLVVIAIVLGLITLLGHGIWLVLAAIFRAIFKLPKPTVGAPAAGAECVYCGAANKANFRFCGVCGRPAASEGTAERLRDLAATGRQIVRWVSTGTVDTESAERMHRLIRQERERLISPSARPEPVRPATSFLDQRPTEVPPVQTGLGRDYSRLPESAWREPVPVGSFREPVESGRVGGERQVELASEPVRPIQPPPPPPAPTPPTKPWSEVIAAFMEQSNIRWGEIIGGLLIVGCSTALVVSLWSEIAAIPVLKFLIFTSVTAALFGVGFYTEHKWKLPTTSRGILTIATLLVPLNFLAIAAVSSGVPSVGGAVLVSELIAPAVFACLVFFAGRILTPRWPHLLAGGVLLTSIGQLLVRHWAEPGMGQSASLMLTALPVLGCLAATVFTLRRAAEAKLDEADVSAIFFTLGASIFAAVLPFGLLLFKSGTPVLTLTNIAPALALVGLSPLAVGIFLWRALAEELSANARTAATAIGIIGGVIALVAMLIGWPNPASVLPAALINCVCWSYLAWTLRWPRFYVIASACLSLAAVIGFAVVGGEVAWQQTPEQFLFQPFVSGASGQALAAVTVLLLVVAEVLRRRGRRVDASYLLVPACVTGLVGGGLGLWFGFNLAGDPQLLSLTLTVLTGAALWVAYRTGFKAPVWIAVGLLWLALRQMLGNVAFFRFPWQTSSLVVASVAAVASSVLCYLRPNDESDEWEERKELFGDPLRWSSLALSFSVIAMLLQSRRWETTAMIDGRLFWLAAISAALLSVIRSRLLFTALQAALTAGTALAIKLVLQEFEWYSYLPSAFLHPWSLQIQGGAIVLTGLVWLALRQALSGGPSSANRSEPVVDPAEAELAEAEPSTRPEAVWSNLGFYLHGPNLTLDQLLTAGVGVAFFVLTIYGASPGVVRELTWPGAPVVMKELAGFPHAAVFGAGAWLLGGLLLIAFLATAWLERKRGFIIGAVALLFAGVPLLAARWEAPAATASAWRWLASVLLISLAAFVWQRERVGAVLKPWGIARDRFTGLGRPLRATLIALGLTPILLFTLVDLGGIVIGEPVGGPNAGFFYWIGPVLSHAIPLAVLICVLLGFARRERASGFAFTAGVTTVFTVIATHLIAAAVGGLAPDRVITVQIFQLIAISSSSFALLWLATRNWWRGTETEAPNSLDSSYLGILLGQSTIALAGFLVPIALRIFTEPTWAGIATVEAGRVRGWLAWGSSIAAAVWWIRTFGKRLSAWVVFGIVLSGGALVAFAAAPWSAGNWRSYHLLLICTLAAGASMLVARWLSAIRAISFEDDENHTSIRRYLPQFAENWNGVTGVALSLAIGLTVVLALRALDDPSHPWWTVLPLLACSALALGSTGVTGMRKAVYAAGGLALIAANVWFFDRIPFLGWYSPDYVTARLSVLSEWLSICTAAVCAIGLIGLLLELRRASRGVDAADAWVQPFHKLAAFVGLALLAVVVGVGLYGDAAGWSLHLRAGFGWAHAITLMVLLLVSVWDKKAWYAVGGLYLAGLGLIGVALDEFDFSDLRLAWTGAAILGAYALITSALWATRDRWLSLLSSLAIPRRNQEGLPGLEWLLWFNAGLVAAALALAFQVVTILEEPQLRFLCAGAATAQVFTFGWLAAGKWRPFVLRAALAVFSAGAVLLAWSFMDPATTGTWLNRAVALMVVLVGLVAVSGLFHERIARFDSGWAGAAHWLMPKLIGTAALGLSFVLITEVTQQIQYRVVMTGLTALILVAATILTAVVLCIYFALSPAHDPLELSERWRPAYVYAAEGLLVLLFVHIRLSVPEIFSGVFTAYWPFVVIAIAFAGVAVSEFLRRRGLMVLAEPLHRTGAFLPLLPAIAFWIVSSNVDYSAVLFAVGMVYGTVSLLRRSFGFGLLAALACNGGLWFFLQHTGSFRIDQHPQIWFIPAALSVLIAGHLNRARLTEEQMTGLRYACLSVIYVSSTFDIFLNGVAQSPWLPMVLAGLAIAGVLCGVAFRVRAFVILGALFLLIAITTMIRYAQVSFGWTWLWYIAGIIAGGLILLTFALFEKKRRELA